MIAYKAVVKAYSGVLLGGKSEHYSAPFERKKDAKDWLNTVMEQNEDADREIDYENSMVFRLKLPSKVVVKAKRDKKARTPAVTVGRKSR